MLRRQMESIAVAYAITEMIVASSRVACTRMTHLSELSGESEDDSGEEQLLQLIELQRNVESFGTRLMLVLLNLVVKAAESTGLYSQQIESEAAKGTTGYVSPHDAPSWTRPIFSTARARAETELRVAQLVRIQRSNAKPPAAYYDGPAVEDVGKSVRATADALEAVLVALSAAEQSDESDPFVAFFNTPIGQKGVGAKENLDGALETMEQTLDTLKAIEIKLPSRAAGGVSPALARAFEGAASPPTKAVASKAVVGPGRVPLVSMNLSKRSEQAHLPRSRSSPAPAPMKLREVSRRRVPER